MRKDKLKYYLALEYTPAFTYNGRVHKRSLGTPLGTLTLLKNRPGNDIPAIKRALRKNLVIFSLNSCEGKESIEFAVLDDG